MNRKSLIFCLVLLCVLIVGTGVAVAFLYSGTGSEERRTRPQEDVSPFGLLAAVPSDAVCVLCSSRDASSAETAVSLHYSGKLTPLYLYDAGAASPVPSDAAARLVDSLSRSGLVATYVDCSSVAVQGSSLYGRSVVLASESETLTKSALRHIGRDMSVKDAPGFSEASRVASGKKTLFISNSQASYLMSAVFSRKYSSYAGFVSRLSDWTVFNMTSSENHMSLKGAAIYDDDLSQFMNVLASSVPAVSGIPEILPSYTLFAASLPVGDLDSYVNAYKGYLDSRQSLQKGEAMQEMLGDQAGMTPYDLMKTLDVREVATAAFMSGGNVEKINLIRSGAKLSSFLEGMEKWPYASFLSAVFGPLFDLDSESDFYTQGEWIVTGSRTAIDEYVSGRALSYTLGQYMADASRPDMLACGKSSFLAYFSLTESEACMKETFRPAFLELVSDLYEGAEYAPFVFSVSSDKTGLSLDAEVRKLALQKTKAPAFERDTLVIVPEGPFEVMNSGTGKKNRFYQNSHLSLCLSEDGKDLWGIPFKDRICGTAANIDYYANGKLQIIFGAGTKIYVIDRLGRYVTGFPIDLGKEILLGPHVYDFNGTKKYNVLVLHKDNTIEMYNLKGQKPAAWKGISADETIKSLPERIVVGGNTFWVVRTSIQTLVFPFYGGEPVTKFTGDQMIRPDSEVKSIDASTVEVSCYDGKRRTVAVK